MKLHRGRKNVTLWLKPEHVEALDRLAEAQGMSLSPFVIQCLADGLAESNSKSVHLADDLRADLAARQHRVPAQFDV